MPGDSGLIFTVKPGFGVAHRTSTPAGEKEIAVLPPTRLNVSVWVGAVVGVGGAGVAVVGEGGGVAVLVGVGAVVGDGSAAGDSVGVVVGWGDAVGVEPASVSAVSGGVPSLPLEIVVGFRSATGEGVGAEPGVVEASAVVLGSPAAIWLMAGAGSMSSSSTIETPVQATATAATLPASQRTKKPMVLITSRVCLDGGRGEFKAALKDP